MARLHDSQGNLLGGFRTASHATTQRPRKYEPGETVVGLECSYGTFAYSYSGLAHQNVSERARSASCHNPVETPDERNLCEACGGYYCTIHSEPAAHDCVHVVRRK